MNVYAKLFARITESSLMEEPINVRYTFVMLLAIADAKGIVVGTDVAIARRLNMPTNEFRQCIEVLMRPDPESNSKEEEGRRVIVSDGERGYKLVNYLSYRKIRDMEDRRQYMREYMQKRRIKLAVNSCKHQLPELSDAEVEAELEAEAEEPTPTEKPPRGVTEGRGSVLTPTTEQSKRIASLFNRRHSTPWSTKEVNAYRKLGMIQEETLLALEGYYRAERAKGEEGRHRRDLGTFLNNFAGEVDRAMAWKQKHAPKQLQLNGVDPASWSDFLKAKGLPVRDSDTAPGYLKDDFRKWLASK